MICGVNVSMRVRSWWVGEKKARAGLWGIYRWSGGARPTSSYRHFILMIEDDDPTMPPIAPQGLMLWTLVWVPMSANADRRRIDLALDPCFHIRTVIPELSLTQQLLKIALNA